MEVFKTHGAISWSELTTTDPAAAAEFYGKLFGWNVKPPEAAMGGYRVVNVAPHRAKICGSAAERP